MGSPEEAALCLKALLGAGHEVKAVITQKDSRGARGGLQPTKVKQTALENGLFVSDDVNDLLSFAQEVDCGIVVAFGRIIKPEILEKIAMVNIHFSLLPRWRGAAPVERALLAGDGKTGVSLMAVDKGLDTGGVFAMQEIEIDDEATAGELRLRLTEIGIELLLERLSLPADAVVAKDSPLGVSAYFKDSVPQSGEPTYAAKITPADLKIGWPDPSTLTLRRIRVGKAWTLFRGERLIVHSAERADLPSDESLVPGSIAQDGVVATSDGAVRLIKVQSAGRAPLDFAAWVKGVHLQNGERLGE